MTASRRRAGIAILLAVLLSLSAVVGSAGAQMGSGPADAASAEPAAPASPGPCEKPALFLRGGESDYVTAAGEAAKRLKGRLNRHR